MEIYIRSRTSGFFGESQYKDYIEALLKAGFTTEKGHEFCKSGTLVFPRPSEIEIQCGSGKNIRDVLEVRPETLVESGREVIKLALKHIPPIIVLDGSEIELDLELLL